METYSLTHAETELRKHLDLSKARITRTDRALVVLCKGKSGTSTVERALTLHCSGRWELSGYPSFGASARIIANRKPVREGNRLPNRDLRKIVSVLRQAAA
jgi:hypothetical protein